ncbi:hypothetical protein Gpo141_00013987, partial [Globisporangium polare]
MNIRGVVSLLLAVVALTSVSVVSANDPNAVESFDASSEANNSTGAFDVDADNEAEDNERSLEDPEDYKELTPEDIGSDADSTEVGADADDVSETSEVGADADADADTFDVDADNEAEDNERSLEDPEDYKELTPEDIGSDADSTEVGADADDVSETSE